MTDEYESTVAALSLEKALALAVYGESVAAYRYRTLCEKTTSETHRAIFVETANEEQGHHIRAQNLARKHFPGSDFVLKPEDKDLVIVGPRLLDVTDRASFDRALELMYESERLTGRFYATLHRVTTHEGLRSFFKEMADECFGHAQRMQAVPPLP